MQLSRLFFNDNSTEIIIKYLHNGKSCDRTAFTVGEASSVLIKIPRSLGISKVTYTISDDDGVVVDHTALEWCGFSGIYDDYCVDLDPYNLGCGLYFITFYLHDLSGIKYIRRDGFKNYPSSDIKCSHAFQFTISDFKYKTPSYSGGIIYHIFVDRFYYKERMPQKDGTAYCDSWDVIPEYPEYPGAPLKNNIFYGGNLYGIIEKLPYISSLGTSYIYLSPIFDAASNHKYDTGDYMTVDAMFGGEEALKALISSASEYSIKIILDGVFNHTGDNSKYFNKYGKYPEVGAYQSINSPYYSWYNFERYPDKYASWWGIEILPRINPDESSCRDYFIGNEGVIRKYAELGIAGFRLDVVDELSDSFVAGIKSVLDQCNNQSVLYGEVWEDASNKVAYGRRKSYYCGGELDGVMNYPVRKGIIDYLVHGQTEALEYALRDIINNAPLRIANMQMNLLGTHDTPRILSVLGNEDISGLTNMDLSRKKLSRTNRELAKARLMQAYCILSTLPGIPSVYYGDEVGIEGYSDPFNRMPYPWNNQDVDLLSWYRQLGTLRVSEPIFKSGDFNLISIDSSRLIYARAFENQRIMVIINNSNSPLHIDPPRDAKLIIGDSINTVLAHSVCILKTESNYINICN